MRVRIFRLTDKEFFVTYTKEMKRKHLKLSSVDTLVSFSIDYNPLPFTAGYVVKVDNLSKATKFMLWISQILLFNQF